MSVVMIVESESVALRRKDPKFKARPRTIIGEDRELLERFEDVPFVVEVG